MMQELGLNHNHCIFKQAKIKALKSQEDRLSILQDKTKTFCSNNPNSKECESTLEKLDKLASNWNILTNK